ncbi:MAG: enoyl-CoA hydratase/isomerase family protein [Myxococcota bacterium]|nr:enoyl-CoA hydratase [Deltaproteobacteria bacterium]MCP4242599.1 enoyl-CoA hydratase/isomerase family protein [bacterium]MDP6074323.1 enoyl-CoA hydratase/isomerase family protein [Myxococcota bacterium]MDP6242519.1 enoyl-CoA hydratase/isomerase family protein [Myxococcota bacterium]MDP7073709.1 enoyl-CoA hydratase/isomerase family protein [Myxococcota bacterium]
MIHLDREGDVFVLRFDAGENRFGPELLDALDTALEEVEKTDGPKALVTTGTGKFYSNGLDLDHMMSRGVEPGVYLARVLDQLARVLVFPCATVAAVNGHAFGAGAQIAVAHDHRLMRADRGFFCMPEIDMQSPLHPGMTALLMARIPTPAVQELIVTGTRYGGTLAAGKGIVDGALAEDELLAAAVTHAGGLASKAHPAMGELKRGMYGPVLAALAEPLGDLGRR